MRRRCVDEGVGGLLVGAVLREAERERVGRDREVDSGHCVESAEGRVQKEVRNLVLLFLFCPSVFSTSVSMVQSWNARLSHGW